MGSIAKACVVAVVGMLLGSATAHATPIGCDLAESRCDSGKYKCVLTLKSCLLECHKKALTRGVGVDGPCLQKCRVKFSSPATGRGCIDKLELKNDECSTLGDGPALRAKVEVHVLDVVARLVPGGGAPRSRCAAEKVKCFYRFDACLLGRIAKALAGGDTCPDYAHCDRYLTGPKSCFEKIENRYRPSTVHECFVYDDQATMKDFDDAFVNDVVHSISGGGKDLRTRRCTNDTSTACVNDTPCVGGGGTCQFFFGGPLAINAGGVAMCVTNQWSGPIAGTLDTASGAMAGSAKLLRRTYVSPLFAQPCPICDGADFLNDGVRDGTCSGGVRTGLDCDGNGESPETSFGVTSLDCPPSVGNLVGTSLVDLTHTNDGVATATVTAASPTCNGQPGKTCLCGSCSGDSTVACTSDAACALAGAGTCSNGAGTARRVNACLDDTTGGDDSICAPTVGDKGECPFAPVDQTCAIDTFRGCIDNLDCPAPNDHCTAHRRPCYPGYDGNVGDTVTATGTHQVPLDHAGTATLAAVFCIPPTISAAANVGQGLPGPGRMALAGVMTDDGTATTCPSHATFLPTSKNDGWDFGWMGLAHGVRAVGQGKVTVAVSGCANATPPCGVCSYTGPVENVNVAP